tara:strand:- start:138 stop:530 length:393 start_codon:yes stop_codon:yes gene_type:complete
MPKAEKTEKKHAPAYVPYSIKKCREMLAKTAKIVEEAEKWDAERAKRPSHEEQCKALKKSEQIVDGLRADTGYASDDSQLVYEVAKAEENLFNSRFPEMKFPEPLHPSKVPSRYLGAWKRAIARSKNPFQ